VPPVRRHLQRLSGGLGIAQHAVGAVPDLRHGYCTDDVASLMADLLYANVMPGPSSRARSVATSPSWTKPSMPGWAARNFRSAAGDWLEAVGSGRQPAVRSLPWARPLRVEDRSVDA
jgi:hypothetical protein